MSAGRANARYTYTRLGRFMAAVIHHIQCFSPLRAMNMPPRIPPIVSAMRPTTPYLVPTCIVFKPSPPTSGLSSRNGEAIFTSCDSAKRKRRIKVKAGMIPFFWKKETKVSKNALRGLPLFTGTSFSGFGRMN